MSLREAKAGTQEGQEPGGGSCGSHGGVHPLLTGLLSPFSSRLHGHEYRGRTSHRGLGHPHKSVVKKMHRILVYRSI